MKRALLVALAFSLSGCGLLLDGVYLISGKRFTKDEEQRKRTDLAQLQFEHEVRAEQGQLWLACEDIERGVDRVWTVHKEYEHQGGMYQVHWLPAILDTIIGGALTIGFGIKCGETSAPATCNALWATVPLWSDAIYSVIRLAMIDPPKLVNKTRTQQPAAPSETPNWRRTVSCEPDAMIVVGPEYFRVDAWGAMNDFDRPRLMSALQNPNASISWSAAGHVPTAAKLSRCEALAGLGNPCPPPPSSR
ncbi:MAG: hypothetical protein QM817_27090 [Archangium sp.]